MPTASALIAEARRRAGLSQEELAQRAGTSRTAVCAYESGSKDPRAETVERLLNAAGHHLTAVPAIKWATRGTGRKTFAVPSALPSLPPAQALAHMELPHHLAWSGHTMFRLTDRHERCRAYEILLTEGNPDDIETVVDGALLVDCWDELHLRNDIRAAWQPLIEGALGR
jgi:transcriptional regulator with XRE-family HTH domain